jgi:hypothetical protein
MKISITLFTFLLVSFTVSSQSIVKHHDKQVNTAVSDYQSKNGRMDGSYTSYYLNGKKKSQGSFDNNMRSGLWTVWDSLGTVKMTRYYTNPFSFTQTILPQNDTSIQINFLTHNDSGITPWHSIEENDVLWMKRIWRYIEPKNNKALFKDDHLFKVMNKNIENKKVRVYSSEGDDFGLELNINKVNTDKINLIGFRIKEDVFFDASRNVMETRIIGICPVVTKEGSNDTLNLFWCYYPELRNMLGSEMTKAPNLPSKVINLDDVFFYRCFQGTIVKESNVHDREISEYIVAEDLDKERERIELELIEVEHDIWLQLAN